MKKMVLFLCTGNSCRSQMAEGFLRNLRGDAYEVYSAGVDPSELNPRAVQVMKEIGIDISKQYAKSLEIYANEHFDIVITVCDHAKESCPLFPGKVQRFHWGLTDPAEAKGKKEEVLRVFRDIRNQIRKNIEETL